MEVRRLEKISCTVGSFLIATKGNWRNSIYINCVDCNQLKKCGGGFLMAPDAEGWPILVTVNAIKKITGVGVEKSECIAELYKDEFISLYSSLLDWQTEDPFECSISQMFYQNQNISCSVLYF